MEQYGSYEVIRELTSDRGSVVYFARTKEAGVAAADGFIVKTFSPAELIGDETQLWRRRESQGVPLTERVFADTEAFLDAVRKQQRAHSEGSLHVAPVLGFGKDERRAWYATRFYPRSIKKIIEGRVRLSAEGFFNVIRSITRGLLDFKRTCGQSHGNLKPSNVLIAGRGKIRQAGIVLVDPAPDKPGEHLAYEIADLHAIGEIMYQLTRRKEVEGTAHWPLLPSPEWSNLFGDAADAWRELCNRLLDPELSVHPMNLEELEAELDKLEPKPLISTPALITIAAVLLLLCVGSYILLSRIAAGKYGAIEVTSAPTGAQVLLNDQPVGTTPYRSKKIVPGELNYLLKLEAYNDYRNKTNITAKTEAKLHIVLSHQTGTVILTSDPSGAQILTNGIVIDKTPSTLTLFSGTHTLTLRYPGLKDQKLPVPVENRQVKSYDVEFPRGEISFTSEPPGAKIVSAGMTIGNTPMKVEVDAGPVSFELQLEGYNTAMFKTNVLAKDKHDVSIKLSEGQGTVSLESDPSGAAVFWDDILRGTTPDQFKLPKGKKELILKYGNLTDQRKTLAVEKDEKQTEFIRFPYATLVVESTPSGAQVLNLTGTNILGITPTTFLVDPGIVNLELKADDSSGTLTTNLANGAKVTVRVALTPGRGKVYVISYPRGATIFSPDGKILGPSESSIELAKGTQELMARHPSYTNLGEQRFSVVVEKNKTTTNSSVRFAYGNLVLRSQPAGAAISADGKQIGVTPHTNFFIKPGPVTYELKLEDYRLEVIATNIVDGQDLTVDAVLKRGIGFITFTSDPAGAQILVDGSLLGTAPLTNDLPAGTHLVIASLGNLPPQTNNIRVRLGDEFTVPFHFDMRLSPGNTPPTISNIEDQTTEQDKTIELAFTIDDRETPAPDLIVTKISSDASLVPERNILMERSGAAVALRITPAPNQSGTSRITLVVSDGSLKATNSFLLAVKAANNSPSVSSVILTNSVGMIFVKVRDDLWVGQSKVTIAQYEKISGDPGMRKGQPTKPAEASWTDAMTFCTLLASEEFGIGKLPDGLSYSLPKRGEWDDIAKIRGLAIPMAAGEAGLNAGGKPGEWCFTTRGDLKQRAPTIVVTGTGTGDLKVVLGKDLDKDSEGRTFRCVLAPPRDDK